MKVGILSLQGDVSEHIWMTERVIHDLKLEGEVIEVKDKKEIKDINALIIPGGESTTIWKLLRAGGVGAEIKRLADRGAPIMGTCAGLILLGRGNRDSLGLMDMKVERNAFGRQRESFEADLRIPKLGKEPYHAIFIRAPVIEEVGKGVEVLAEYDGKTVMARQDRLVAVAFHPELTPDLRIHRYFLGLLKK
ncbi:MAG: pyridoxal 5'-phosphate synthase glutaminase subunit PdxT [Candidatus Altiarchaeales archaeon]|nr:MAG: pyridoxal 5'-phosphate synthase glutaminase subunit PdxT [Candidatus Altiarchaeales archaeon]